MRRAGILLCIGLGALAGALPAAAAVAPPAVVTPPALTGEPYKGSVLTCTTGEWANEPAAYERRWLRNGVAIPDQTADTYTVTGEDVGARLACVVTAGNDAGSAEATPPDLQIVTIAVRFTVKTPRRQPGPKLRVRGYVVTRTPAAAGAVVLTREVDGNAKVVARAVPARDGEFALDETIRALVPGKVAYTLRFEPADPELYSATELLLPIAAVSPATYPFARSRLDRPATVFDQLASFWADGGWCSVGCRPSGARTGWPLKPFHEQHGLRSGLNERRDKGFHLGIDIQAEDRQPVYAVQAGRAHILQAHGTEARVQVGNYVYWHVKIYVREGEWVPAYSRIVGIVHRYTRHLHLSELRGAEYMNPLRPGGRVLEPWTDTEPPVIGRPSLARDGSVVVAAFDPQSFVTKTGYITPVLAPAALAYRVYDANGHRVGRLEWALRGTHRLSPGLVGTVFTPLAHRPGWRCFALQLICRPNWQYRLAGGLAPRVPLGSLGRGRYRLAVYAWDWAGNVRARDLWFAA